MAERKNSDLRPTMQRIGGREREEEIEKRGERER
jgi:hypothetical protein